MLENDVALQPIVIACLLAILLMTLVMMLPASPIQSLLGVIGMHVVTRIFGILLCALAVQFIFDGITESGLPG